MARPEDVKRLQQQLDQMKERLDFISPMLSSVNFIQDYFQRVECEATLQLLRLKNAKVVPPSREGADDELSNAQLEIAKWVHFITDVVMAMHSWQAVSAEAESMQSAKGRGVSQLPRPLGVGTQQLASSVKECAPQQPQQQQPLLPEADPPLTLKRVADLSPNVRRMAPDTSPHASGPTFGLQEVPPALGLNQGRRSVTPLLQRPDHVATDLLWQQPPADRTLSGELPSRVGAFPLQDRSVNSTMNSDLLGGGVRLPAPASASTAGNVRGPQLADENGGSRGGASKFSPAPAPDDTLYEPNAEPGTSGTESASMSMELTGSGLVMGRGSWATAYRQATGMRREALRLLCSSGIVTARELGEDLTVISEDHIEECVQIATEMLQTWPMDMWERQPEETRNFFEGRLASLYHKKFAEISKLDM